jgi:hypothetical protein
MVVDVFGPESHKGKVNIVKKILRASVYELSAFLQNKMTQNKTLENILSSFLFPVS